MQPRPADTCAITHASPATQTAGSGAGICSTWCVRASLISFALCRNLGLQVFLALLQFCFLAAKLLVLRLQGLNISVARCSKALLDELDGVSWFFGLFVEADQHFGQVVDDACLLEVVSELLLLLLGRLNAHA